MLTTALVFKPPYLSSTNNLQPSCSVTTCRPQFLTANVLSAAIWCLLFLFFFFFLVFLPVSILLPLTDLDPPRDLEVTETTETTMTVAWKRPRAKIGNYRLVVESVVDGRRDEVEVPGDATTYTLTGRTPGTRYTISLVAERGRKRSEPVTTTASTGELLSSILV